MSAQNTRSLAVVVMVVGLAACNAANPTPFTPVVMQGSPSSRTLHTLILQAHNIRAVC